MALGIVVALLAAICFEAGYLLQALEARTAPRRHSLRASLLMRLASRPRWLGGTLLSLAGAGLQVIALTQAPVTLVQPVLALGLVALLVAARPLLGERLGGLEAVGAAAVIAGVVAVGVEAPHRTGQVTSVTALVLLTLPLALLTLLPFALRRHAALGLAAAGAAAGDGLAAVLLKLTADAASAARWGLALAAASGAVAVGSLALTAEMSALRGLPASRVAPPVVAAQVVVPAIAAMVAFGEPAATGVVLGVTAAGAGAALLGSSRAVGGLLTGTVEPEPLAHDGRRGREGDEGRSG